MPNPTYDNAGGGATVGHDESVEPTPSDREFGDPSRRTFLAQERTLLAWWRTAFAAIGVALAVGRIVPEIAHLPKVPFLVVGVGWGVLAIGLITFGFLRQRAGDRAIRAGGYLHVSPRWLVALTLYMVALMVATIAVLFIHS
jgi:putative membrane protein